MEWWSRSLFEHHKKIVLSHYFPIKIIKTDCGLGWSFLKLCIFGFINWKIDVVLKDIQQAKVMVKSKLSNRYTNQIKTINSR
jgi:hypothetical protein